jgi:hypothetical protein
MSDDYLSKPSSIPINNTEEISDEASRLNEALSEAVDEVAQSLRDDERKSREESSPNRLHLFAILFSSIAVITITFLALSWALAFSYRVLFEETGEQVASKQPEAIQASEDTGLTERLEAPEQSIDIGPLQTGKYTMRLPKDYQWQVLLVPLEDKKFRLTSNRALNHLGIYERRENLLVMINSDDERLTEFQWRILSRTRLILVEEPSTRKTGATYLGTELTYSQEQE